MNAAHPTLCGSICETPVATWVLFCGRVRETTSGTFCAWERPERFSALGNPAPTSTTV
jgi:hypothetical protein